MTEAPVLNPTPVSKGIVAPKRAVGMIYVRKKTCHHNDYGVRWSMCKQKGQYRTDD